MDFWGVPVDFADALEKHIAAITAVIAIAAIFQWRETRINAERQLRAYVAVALLKVKDGAPNHPDWIACDIVLKNTGQTPARNVRNWIKIDVSTTSNPALQPLGTDKPNPANIPAGGETYGNDIWMVRGLAANEIPAIQARTQAVFVYGLIKYTDVFGKDRETHYRLFHSGSWPPAVGHIMYFTDKGNSFT